MPTTLESETKIETAEEAKVRRNTEYLAMLDESIRQSERGEVVTMTFKKWKERFYNE